MSKSTPWGPSQSSRHIGEGIISHSCARHGGFYVPPEKLQEMPSALRCNVYAGGGSWFEEDCEWALVCLAFPYLFTNYQIWQAGRTIRGAAETYKRAALWLHLEPGEQVAALVDDFETEHAKDYHLNGASTSGGGWSCIASTLDGSARVRFTVKEWPRLWSRVFNLQDLAEIGAEDIKQEAAA